ncbi:hypothetical protein [Sphingomonas sp. KR3-1]|uniref:hypothetical protein n=1 Tax=Sphingomonas sp. KR3-1 TaxID=3156611 RepID=UPI0032B58F05
MHMLLGLALALASPEAFAQIPDISATPHSLRTMSPSQLGALLFGEGSPPFTDAWVEGPTRRWRAITVDLATTPVPTGYDGLCALKTATTYFMETETPREDEPVQLGTSLWVNDVFLLTSDNPGLQPSTGSTGCIARKPLSEYVVPPTILRVENSLKDGRPDTDPAVPRFALSALIAAQKQAEHQHVSVERCSTGFTDVPAACGDPGAFVRGFYLRQVIALTVARCPKASTLCIDAAVQGLGGFGLDHVVVATGETIISEKPASAISVRSIVARAGSDPIVD